MPGRQRLTAQLMLLITRAGGHFRHCNDAPIDIAIPCTGVVAGVVILNGSLQNLVGGIIGRPIRPGLREMIDKLAHVVLCVGVEHSFLGFCVGHNLALPRFSASISVLRFGCRHTVNDYHIFRDFVQSLDVIHYFFTPSGFF
nr:MAG TPA: hypothetical protein [Caudoviricetes sp.]